MRVQLMVGTVGACVLAIAGRAAPIEQGEWRVVAALQVGDSLDVESPVDVPWDSLARRALPTLDFLRPDTTLLARFFYEPGGSSDIPFVAPTLPRVPRSHYTGLATDGTVALTVVRLAGYVSFSTRPPDWHVEAEPTTYGRLRVVRPSPGTLRDVYFVHWSAAAPAFTSHEATVVRLGDSLRVTATLPTGRTTWTVIGDEHGEPGAEVKISGRVFVDATSRRTLLLIGMDYGQRGNPCIWYGAVFDVTGAPERLTFTGVCDA